MFLPLLHNKNTYVYRGKLKEAKKLGAHSHSGITQKFFIKALVNPQRGGVHHSTVHAMYGVSKIFKKFNFLKLKKNTNASSMFVLIFSIEFFLYVYVIIPPTFLHPYIKKKRNNR